MIVTPYGDPTAHGSIGKCLTFIRRRGIVYSRPYKVPFDPRSTAQLDQRNKFKQGKLAWDALSSESKDYFNARAEGESYSGFNLFMHFYLLDQLPSESPFYVEDITNSWIGILRSSHSNGWTFRFAPDPGGANYGTISDNENIYHDAASYSPARILTVDIVKNAQDIDIHMRDTVIIVYDIAQQLTIYLPETNSNVTLWVAEDGSTYYDDLYTKLACSATG